MRVNKYLLPIVTILALFGAVGFAKATGFWAVTGKGMVDLENLTSGADIRGWMTMEQISEGYGIPKGMLYHMLELSNEIPPTTALKELEGLSAGFSVGAVREAVEAYLQGEILEIEHEPLRDDEPDEGQGPTPLAPDEVLSADQIRGRHSLVEIAEGCQVPLNELIASLGLPADVDANTRVRELMDAGLVGEMSVLREVVRGLQGDG